VEQQGRKRGENQQGKQWAHEAAYFERRTPQWTCC
jgi:hypothetical protein